MIDRVKNVKSTLAAHPRIRRASILLASLALIVWIGSIVHYRLTHVEEIDARVATEMITIAPRLPGWLVERPVMEGDRIQKGQTLAVLYRDPSRLQAQSQEAALGAAEKEIERLEHLLAEQRASTQAAVMEAESGVKTAEEALKAAQIQRANAESDYRRSAALVKLHAVPEQEAEHAENAYKVAKQNEASAQANLEAAKARLARARADARLGSLERQLEQARVHRDQVLAERDLARLNLEDLTLTAPIDGVVDRTFSNEGDYVSASQRVMLIHDPEAVWVEANIKETKIADVRPGQPVEVTIDGIPGRVFHGEVWLIGNAATSTFQLLPNPNPSGNFTKITQRIPVRIRVKQEDGLLKPGMMAVVSIDVRH